MIEEYIVLCSTIGFSMFLFFMWQRLMARKKQKALALKEQQQAFLEQHKTKEGVVTTSSGLQYQIIEEGDGENYPSPTSRVKAHYHGTLVDGTVLDSSVDRGKPAFFGLNEVIPGLMEALQLMSVGAKAQLCIPPELGYSARAIGKIPSNSNLIFEVELLSIEED